MKGDKKYSSFEVQLSQGPCRFDFDNLWNNLDGQEELMAKFLVLAADSLESKIKQVDQPVLHKSLNEISTLMHSLKSSLVLLDLHSLRERLSHFERHPELVFESWQGLRGDLMIIHARIKSLMAQKENPRHGDSE